jgi:hypothetical protein
MCVCIVVGLYSTVMSVFGCVNCMYAGLCCVEQACVSLAGICASSYVL